MITLNTTFTSNFTETFNGFNIQGTYSYDKDNIVSIDAYITLNEEHVGRFHIYNYDSVLKINRVDFCIDYMDDCDIAIKECFNEIKKVINI